MVEMFYSCNLVKSLDLSNFDTKQVTSFSFFMAECTSLKEIKFSSKFDTSSATDLSAMFSRCISLASLDLSYFNTENVKYMNYMFNECTSLSSMIYQSLKHLM